MSEPSRQPDLTWMPKTCAEEFQELLDSLCALRLQLAGLALRHTIDAGGQSTVNAGLQADIVAIQASLQKQIDRARETFDAMRDLARVVKDERPGAPAAPEKETLH